MLHDRDPTVRGNGQRLDLAVNFATDRLPGANIFFRTAALRSGE